MQTPAKYGIGLSYCQKRILSQTAPPALSVRPFLPRPGRGIGRKASTIIDFDPIEVENMCFDILPSMSKTCVLMSNCPLQRLVSFLGAITTYVRI